MSLLTGTVVWLILMAVALYFIGRYVEERSPEHKKKANVGYSLRLAQHLRANYYPVLSIDVDDVGLLLPAPNEPTHQAQNGISMMVVCFNIGIIRSNLELEVVFVLIVAKLFVHPL